LAQGHQKSAHFPALFQFCSVCSLRKKKMAKREEWDPTDLDNEMSAEEKDAQRVQWMFGDKDLMFRDHPAFECLDDSSKLKLAGMAQVSLEAAMPWKRVADVKPNLAWYTPTCTAEDWKHKDVMLEIGQGIAYVTLNRPDFQNTLNDTIMHGLMDAVFAMHARKDVRIVCFCAKGPMYCAGADPVVFKNMRSGKHGLSDDGSTGKNPVPKKPQSKEAAEVFQKLCQDAKDNGAFGDGEIIEDQVRECLFWQTMTRLPQITVGMVQGSVVGTGLFLVSCVDMSYAVSNSFYQMPDLKQGFVPAILLPHLCQKLGPSNGRYVALTGLNLNAEEAKSVGLVQEICADEAGMHAKLADLCEAVTGCGPRSVESCKELINGVAGNPITEKIMFFTGGLLAKVTVSDEAAVSMVCLQKKIPKPWEEKPITPFK